MVVSVEVKVKDTYRFDIDAAKLSVKVDAINTTTKFKYKFSVTKAELKSAKIRKSVKGLSRLLENGLNKNDDHIKIEIFFLKSGKKGEGQNTAEEILPLEEVEEYDIPDQAKNTGEPGHDLFVYLVYTSDYDEESEYLYRFYEQEEDESARLRELARDRQKETLDFSKRIDKLSTDIVEQTGYYNHMVMKVRAWRGFLKKQGNAIDKKHIKGIKKRLKIVLKKELLFFLAQQHKNLAKEIKLTEHVLQGLSKFNPSGLDESVILEEDDEWIDLLSEWGEEQKIDSWKLLYRATKDGMNASTFHTKSNNKGKTYTIIKTSNGWVFGAFNPSPWTSNGNYSSSTGSFIFSLKNASRLKAAKYGDNGQHNSNKTYGANNNGSYGPTFGGGHDFYLCANFGTNSNYSNLCHSYLVPGRSYNSQQAKSFLAGSYNFTVSEVEVFGEDMD